MNLCPFRHLWARLRGKADEPRPEPAPPAPKPEPPSERPLWIHMVGSYSPQIFPSRIQRDWMLDTGDYAGRCLPMRLACQYGWEICAPVAVSLLWNGGAAPSDLTVIQPCGEARQFFDGHVGHGIMTFHIPFIVQTPKGVDTLFTGPFNQAIPGVYPLSGIVETDWLAHPASLNFRVTEPDRWIHIQRGTPLGLIVPLQRGFLEGFKPWVIPVEKNEHLVENFLAFSKKKTDFDAQRKQGTAKQKFQGQYMRGLDGNDQKQADHVLRMKLDVPSVALLKGETNMEDHPQGEVFCKEVDYPLSEKLEWLAEGAH